MTKDRGVRVAVLTVSDGCYRGTREDLSGDLLVDWCRARGYELVGRETVPDETHAIVPWLLEWSDRGDAHLIVTTGGTGFSPRDVTPEATRSVVDREASGVSEALKRAGEAKTPHAVLSRGVVGMRGRTVIVNLPGSPGGVRDGLDVLETVAPHAIRLLRDEDTVHLASEPARDPSLGAEASS